MYDHVNYSMTCPVCGTLIEEFQTKDKERLLDTYEISEVNNFYALCHVCDLWVEFTKISNQSYE